MKQKIKLDGEGAFLKKLMKKLNGKVHIAISIFCSVILIYLMVMNKQHNIEESNIDNNSEKIVTKSKIEEDTDDKIQKIDLDKSMNQIEKINIKVHEILGTEEQHYGVYYYDLNTGCQYFLNSNKEFKAASTIKVPIAMMIADKLSNNELKNDILIEYTSEDKCDGAGVLQGSISEGDKLEVMQLMKYMIEESDNVATSMLKRSVGNLYDYITDLTSIKISNEDNFITPTQSCIVLQKLYEKSNNNIYYKNIIEFMKQTTTHDRIDKYIPNDIVAHKIGDYERYVNDIGIIYTDEPYILAIYTEDVMEKGRENIAQISKAIYEIKTDN